MQVKHDAFIFGQNAPFSAASLGIDVITDFDSTSTILSPEQDIIVLDRSAFTGVTAVGGILTASQFASVANDGDADTSSALIVYGRGTGNVFFNPNLGAAGFAASANGGGAFATLTGSPNNIANTHFAIQA